MEPAKKELIEEIVDLFEDYQEEYVPGEWEAFSADNKKKRAVLIPYWLKVAAVLLLVAGAVPFGLNILGDRNDQPDYAAVEQTGDLNGRPVKAGAEVKSGSGKTVTGNSAGLSSTAAGVIHAAGKAVSSGMGLAKSGPVNRIVVAVTIPAVAHQDVRPPVYVALQKVEEITEPVNGSAAREAGHQVAVVAEAKAVPANNAQSTIDFLLAESKAAAVAKTAQKKEKTNKWDFGIEVAPTMMRSNVNLGAGITTAYRISKNFAVSSGISMLQMEGGSNGAQSSGSSSMMNAPSSSSFTTLSSKKLVAVDANIRAIDIPIGITYNLNRNLYTNIGVSYLNIFRDKRSNTYENTSAVLRTATDPATGQPATYQALESNETEEPAGDSPLKGNSYLGFFNFSVGRDQQIFSKYHFRIEPFVKVPIGKLSDQELNLMNSGIRFKFAF